MWRTPRNRRLPWPGYISEAWLHLIKSMGKTEGTAAGAHTLVPIETESSGFAASEAEESGVTPSSTSKEASDGGKGFAYPTKPFTSWSEDDFPNKPEHGRRGVNKILGLYTDARKALFKKRPLADNIEPICCDGVAGLFGLLFFLLVDVAYVVYACFYEGLDKDGDVHLLWMSVVLWLVILVKMARRLVRLARTKGGCWRVFAPMSRLYHSVLNGLVRLLTAPWRAVWSHVSGDEVTIQRRKDLTKNIIAAVIMLGFAAFCITYYVIMVNVENLISLSGIGLLVLISIALSRFPDKINWQPVLICFFIQLFLAFITLKTHAGYVTFDFLGKRMAEFLENSQAGSRFVFGSLECFAFSVLPMVIFFSSFTAVCFHLGIIQLIIDKPSKLATKFIKTTGPETLNAIANIFFSMTEAPLITRPYLPMSTNSELHAMIVNGFASIAGSVLAAFISFGIPANHLLISCILSAPAALAVSKIMYPETKMSPLANSEISLKMKSPYNSALEAAMVGAMEAIPICAGIVANLIALLSLYNFLNRILIWLGRRVSLQFDLTFEVIFSYVLWPIAVTMGVPIADALKVAELIGVKIFLNEFAAYQRLGLILQNRVLLAERNTSLPINYLPNGDWRFTLKNGTTVIATYGALFTEKAQVLSTYALCGFANIGSVGIFLGAMIAILPQRRVDLTNMIVYGMIGGNIACFLTGCFAGLFYDKFV
ncbi:Solute carrier family 28 member 3 [Taenia crassiceps]|uniref:Solute carrier family 28 member 3 n=1 Tax=Taenia crassiceps TaxID=6207 RepID=A0ABR4QGZ1_9CEST